MNLRDNVTEYYFSKLHELPKDKQFHIGNRLAAWTGDERALKILKDLRAHYTPRPTTEQSLHKLFRELLNFEPANTIPAYKLRRPYFAKYPSLTGTHNAILRLRHLHTVYGVNALSAFNKAMPAEQLKKLEDNLIKDTEALRVLSTYAINTIYLFNMLVLDDKEVDAQAFYKAGQNGYDTEDPEQLRLLIYFYTHCIIAASNFYTKKLPESQLPIYKDMMRYLEPLINRYFDFVSLDTKVEFWVCCRVAGLDTTLAEKIDQECEASLSPDGMYIIDTHNIFAKIQNKKNLTDSEHRNTLYILSGSPFNPHSTFVG